MTRDIKKIAKSAGFTTGPYGCGIPKPHAEVGSVSAPWLHEALQRFARMVAAEVQEECATAAESAKSCAQAAKTIRAMGKP